MLRHEKESEQPQLYRAPAPEQAHAETIPAIEIYLDKTYLPSLGEIEETHRAVLRYEMRANLMAAVKLREDHGLSRQHAIAETLRDVETALKEVEERATTRTVQSVKLSSGFDLRDTAKAAVLFGIPYVLDATRVSGWLWDRYINRSDTLFYGLELFAIPAIAGCLIGASARKNAPRAVLGGLAALAMMGLLVPAMVTIVAAQNQSTWKIILDQFTKSAGVGIASWTLLGTLGAAAAQRMFKRKHLQKTTGLSRQKLATCVKPLLSHDTGIAFAAYAMPAAMLLSNQRLFGIQHLVGSDASTPALLAALFGFPLVSGLVTGCAIRKSPGKAGLRALSAIAALLILLPSLVESVSLSTNLNGFFMFGIVQSLAAGFLGWWAIMGSIGAMIGRRIRGGNGKADGRSMALAVSAFRRGKDADGTDFAPKRQGPGKIVLPAQA